MFNQDQDKNFDTKKLKNFKQVYYEQSRWLAWNKTECDIKEHMKNGSRPPPLPCKVSTLSYNNVFHNSPYYVSLQVIKLSVPTHCDIYQDLLTFLYKRTINNQTICIHLQTKEESREMEKHYSTNLNPTWRMKPPQPDHGYII